MPNILSQLQDALFARLQPNLDITGISTVPDGEVDKDSYPSSCFVPYPVLDDSLEEEYLELLLRLDFESPSQVNELAAIAAVDAIPLSEVLPVPEPDWLALVSQFAVSDNSLYSSIQIKASMAENTALSMDAFGTLKLVILQKDLQSPQLLAAAMASLRTYITLDAEEIEGWNQLMQAKNFPPYCLLE